MYVRLSCKNYYLSENMSCFMTKISGFVYGITIENLRVKIRNYLTFKKIKK